MASSFPSKYDIAFHAISLLVNIVGCGYELKYIHLPMYSTYGGRFKFLTHLSQYLNALYFCFAVAVVLASQLALGRKDDGDDLARPDSDGKLPRIIRALIHFRDCFFVSICFPLAVMVGLLFWGVTLATWDNGGTTSRETRTIVPLFGLYNHYLHTIPLILSLTGIFLVKFRYPERKYGILAVSAFSLLYIAWFVHIGNHTGYWMYPFIEHQKMGEFLLFVIGSALAAILVYIFGEKLSFFFWRRDAVNGEFKLQ